MCCFRLRDKRCRETSSQDKTAAQRELAKCEEWEDELHVFPADEQSNWPRKLESTEAFADPDGQSRGHCNCYTHSCWSGSPGRHRRLRLGASGSARVTNSIQFASVAAVQFKPRSCRAETEALNVSPLSFSEGFERRLNSRACRIPDSETVHSHRSCRFSAWPNGPIFNLRCRPDSHWMRRVSDPELLTCSGRQCTTQLVTPLPSPLEMKETLDAPGVEGL